MCSSRDLWRWDRGDDERTARDGPSRGIRISDGHIDEAETAHAIAVNKEVVTRILDKLPERERLIVELRFGLNGREQHTLKRAGEVIGVTKERIRQLEQRAYRLMRREIAASGITSDTGEELDRRLLEC